MPTPDIPTLPASYTTVDAVLEQVSPKIGSSTTITSAHVAHAIGMAQGVMNGRLSKKYSLPFTTQIPQLTAICTDLAGYRILRRFFTGEKMNKSEWALEFRDSALAELEEIASGAIELYDTTDAVVGRSLSEEAWSNTQDYIPTAADLDLIFQRVDPDKTDDLQTEREP